MILILYLILHYLVNGGSALSIEDNVGKIDTLTVYGSNVAQIKRHFTIPGPLAKGVHQVTLVGLNPKILENSIDIRPIDNSTLTERNYKIKVLDFELRQVPLPRFNETILASLRSRVIDLRSNIEFIQQEEARNRRLLAAVDEVVSKVVSSQFEVDAETGLSTIAHIDLPDASQIFESQILYVAKVHAEMEALSSRKGVLMASLSTAQAALKDAMVQAAGRTGAQAKQNSVLTFQIEALQQVETASTMSLTYMVRQAQWWPTYDVRLAAGPAGSEPDLAAEAPTSLAAVKPRSRPLQHDVIIQYNAIVEQSSEEDWVDVRLVLSTATPSFFVPQAPPSPLGAYFQGSQPPLQPPVKHPKVKSDLEPVSENIPVVISDPLLDPLPDLNSETFSVPASAPAAEPTGSSQFGSVSIRSGSDLRESGTLSLTSGPGGPESGTLSLTSGPSGPSGTESGTLSLTSGPSGPSGTESGTLSLTSGRESQIHLTSSTASSAKPHQEADAMEWWDDDSNEWNFNDGAFLNQNQGLEANRHRVKMAPAASRKVSRASFGRSDQSGGVSVTSRASAAESNRGSQQTEGMASTSRTGRGDSGPGRGSARDKGVSSASSKSAGSLSSVFLYEPPYAVTIKSRKLGAAFTTPLQHSQHEQHSDIRHRIRLDSLKLDGKVFTFVVPSSRTTPLLRLIGTWPTNVSTTLLPSRETRVFLQDELISYSRMAAHSPGQRLHLNVGADSNIEFDFTELNEHHPEELPLPLSREAMMGHRYYVWDYRMKVSNRYPKDSRSVLVLASENLPRSAEGELVVELVHPTNKQLTAGVVQLADLLKGVAAEDPQFAEISDLISVLTTSASDEDAFVEAVVQTEALLGPWHQAGSPSSEIRAYLCPSTSNVFWGTWLSSTQQVEIPFTFLLHWPEEHRNIYITSLPQHPTKANLESTVKCKGKKLSGLRSTMESVLDKFIYLNTPTDSAEEAAKLAALVSRNNALANAAFQYFWYGVVLLLGWGMALLILCRFSKTAARGLRRWMILTILAVPLIVYIAICFTP